MRGAIRTSSLRPVRRLASIRGESSNPKPSRDIGVVGANRREDDKDLRRRRCTPTMRGGAIRTSHLRSVRRLASIRSESSNPKPWRDVGVIGAMAEDDGVHAGSTRMREDSSLRLRGSNSWSSRHSFLPSSATATATAAVGVAESKSGTSSPQALFPPTLNTSITTNKSVNAVSSDGYFERPSATDTYTRDIANARRGRQRRDPPPPQRPEPEYRRPMTRPDGKRRNVNRRNVTRL